MWPLSSRVFFGGGVCTGHNFFAASLVDVKTKVSIRQDVELMKDCKSYSLTFCVSFLSHLFEKELNIKG